MASPVFAIDSAMLGIDRLSGNDWQLNDIKLEVTGLNQTPQIKLRATKLILPKPFHDVTLADIQCHDFSWQENDLECKRGRASVKSKYWQSPSTAFSFRLTNTAALLIYRMLG
ncbi:MAG: hypothetical protein FJ190_06350 [Gammaproteobacteria bacterium]|nr:hypothetical protein [Gammaproteobacteria bacterium]